MSASHELLEKVLQHPKESPAMDRFIVGLAIIGGIQEDPTSQSEDRTEALNAGLILATGALNELRINPEINEAQKVFLAQQVMSSVDLKKLPESLENTRLFVATLLTLADGEIQKKIHEGWSGLSRSFIELSESMLYGEINDELTPREKVIYLYESVGSISPEERRQIAILRACQFATDPNVDDEAFGDVVKYFSEIDDSEALGKVTMAKFESIVKSHVA